MKKPVYTALVVAAGGGLRMHSPVRKQFMDLCGRPVIYYSLEAFEESEYIDHIVLVVPGDAINEATHMCVRNGFGKVRDITEGDTERFRSVYKGLLAAPEDTDYVLVHDGVRPLLSADLIERCCKYVPLTMACVTAVPVTDTIKRGDPSGYARETLDRDQLWSIQTPQAFSFPLLKRAYASLYRVIEEYGAEDFNVTDEAVIVENMTDTRVRIIKGDPRNIKITTPDDLLIAKALLESREEDS